MGQNSGSGSGLSHPRQDSKIFCGGLSWGTTAEKLEAYFSNFGQVLEAFVSYDRHTGRPRGFGFVVFEDPQVAEKVASLSHTIDRREVEAKKAVPKEEHPGRVQGGTGLPPGRTRKVFVGGLAPSVDEAALRQYFEQFGAVDDAVVMFDHESRRPRGFGFVTFASEDTVEEVLNAGPLQALHDKQIEIKKAVPRDQMPPPRVLPLGTRAAAPAYLPYGRSSPYSGYVPPFPQPGHALQGPAYGLQPQGFGQTAYNGGGYRGGGLSAAGIGQQLGAMPALGGAQLGGLAGINTAGFSAPYGGGHGMAGDPNQLIGSMGGGFGQNPYAVSGLAGSGLGGGMGNAGDVASSGLGNNGGLTAGALAGSSFNLSSLQSALPAVQTGGGGADSLVGASGGGSAYNSIAATPHKDYGTPHAGAPQSPAAPATSNFIASSPSAFDSALGSPIGSGLAIPHVTPHGSVGAGSLGRETPVLSGLQSSFTDTPLGSANWG